MTDTSDIEVREQAVTEREAANERQTAELAEQALVLTRHEEDLNVREARQEETAKDLKDFERTLEARASIRDDDATDAARRLIGHAERLGVPHGRGLDVMANRAKQIQDHERQVNEQRQRTQAEAKRKAEEATEETGRTGRHAPNTSPYA